MKTGLRIDWKSEPNLREKALFCIIPLMLLIPAIRSFWLPVNEVIGKAKADLNMVEMQIGTIKKVLDMTTKETAAKSSAQTAETTVRGDRAMRIMSRQTGDRNQEVANAVNALSSRELMNRLYLQDIFIGGDITMQSFRAVPLDITLKGGYGSIERYLAEVEKIERPFLVRGIRLTKLKGEGGLLDGRFTIWVYLPAMAGSAGNNTGGAVNNVKKK